MAASFKPLSRDCAENFAHFKEFFGKSYSLEAEALRNFCLNFDRLLANPCPVCSVTSIFDEDLSAKLMDVRVGQAPVPQKGATVNCSRVYCYAEDPLEQLAALPESVDLRELGLVTPAKNQMRCGVCWSFSVIAVLENAYLLDGIQVKQQAFRGLDARNVSFSEQFVIRNVFNRDTLCSASNAVPVLNYMVDYDPLESIELEANHRYLYSEEQQQLFLAMEPLELTDAVRSSPYLPWRLYPRKAFSNVEGTPQTPVISLMSGSSRRQWNDSKVRSYLARGIAVLGLMYVGVTDNARAAFNSYDGTSYLPAVGCPKNGADHQIVFVGYGKKNGVDCWVVKNSWGSGFGNAGSFYVQADSNEYCIEQSAYAIIPRHYDAGNGAFSKQLRSAYSIQRGEDGLDKDSNADVGPGDTGANLIAYSCVGAICAVGILVAVAFGVYRGMSRKSSRAAEGAAGDGVVDADSAEHATCDNITIGVADAWPASE